MECEINVISRKDIDSLYIRHILHSLAIAAYLKEVRPEVMEEWKSSGNVNVLDLGTGGGFPGIPLAVLFPNVNLPFVIRWARKPLWLRLLQKP